MDPRLSNSEGADFNTSDGLMVFANSHGFYGEFKSSSFSTAVSPIAVGESPF